MPLMEGMKVAEALDNRKLFIIDYEFLKDLPCTDGRKASTGPELLMIITSVASQKGAIYIQRCSIENQKGAIAVLRIWRYRPSGSQRNIFE